MTFGFKKILYYRSVED